MATYELPLDGGLYSLLSFFDSVGITHAMFSNPDIIPWASECQHFKADILAQWNRRFKFDHQYNPVLRDASVGTISLRYMHTKSKQYLATYEEGSIWAQPTGEWAWCFLAFGSMFQALHKFRQHTVSHMPTSPMENKETSIEQGWKLGCDFRLAYWFASMMLALSLAVDPSMNLELQKSTRH